jgi:hypothetical protein
MIQLKYRNWQAVRLQNALSIEYLNELFAAGWYLMEIDLGELMCLAFSMPASPPTRDERTMIVVRESQRTPSIVVVIVSRGRSRDRQRAVFVEDGVRAATPDGDRRTWRRFFTLPVEEGGSAVVYERRTAESRDAE